MDKLPFEKIKRRILVKKKAETNPDYGKIPEKRTAEEIINYGIVNIDKPQGPSSHEITSFVKKILNIKKAGHSGTLDPKVTGVLPTATGKATRIVQTLLKAGKEYVAIMHLHKKVEKSKIKKTFKEFTGKIKQLPPVKSAVKRQLREREIYYIDIIEIDKQDILFKTGCQAGTYIRKLIHDIGEKLEIGAHMVELRRTKAGPFDEETLITLHDLTDAYYYYKKENNENQRFSRLKSEIPTNEKFIRHCIKPVEFAAQHLAKIWVPDQAVDSLAHGIDLKVPGISKLHDKIQKQDTVAVMTLKDELIAIGTARMSSEEIMEKDKGNAVNIKKVFMQPNIYPKIKS